MSKYSIFPDSIKELLEADAEGRQIHTKNTAKQYRYEARERVKQALVDIQWYAETQPQQQCEQVFNRKPIGNLVKTVLQATNDGVVRDFVTAQNNRAFKIAVTILKTVHGSLNEILDPHMIQRVKLSYPDITRRQYSNIAALELMFTLYF